MMRVVLMIVGIVIAAAGGVVAYRAAFVEPREVFVVSDKGVREYPDLLRVGGGSAMLVAGAALAFYAARRRS